MIETVNVDISKLCDEYNRDASYIKGFGNGSFLSDTRNMLTYNLVTDENARFICVFGVFVNIDNGDVALGMCPNPNRYIRITNFYEQMHSFMNLKKKDKLDIEVYKYLLEWLKINPSYVSEHHEEFKSYVSEMLKGKNRGKGDINSIVLNLVRQADKDRGKLTGDNIIFGNEYVEHLIEWCLNFLTECQTLSRDFFGQFIYEENIQEVLDIADMGITKLSESNLPNVEAKFVKLLIYDIPYDLLIAIRSYGFGIKNRSKLLSVFGRRGARSKDILKVGEILSSLSYIDSGESIPVMWKTYNILDILRAVGGENELLFSLEVLTKYKNSSLLEGLVKKYNLNDIIKDCEMSYKDFMINVDKYNKRFVRLIDAVGAYAREVRFHQYAFSSLSSISVLSSGKVFEKAGSMILSKF